MMAYGITNNFDVAETSDVDGDGVPAWQEYRANTDPTDRDSRFAIVEFTNDAYGRYQVTFTTAINRLYRVDASTDLVNWQTLHDNIPGTGTPIMVTDPRSPELTTQMHYRVQVW